MRRVGRPLASLGTLAAFRSEQFRLLFTGLIAGHFGIWIEEFAVSWLVVQIALNEGRPELAAFYLGLRSIASAVPSLAVGLFAGVYADRVDRRDLLMRTRIAASAIAIVMAGIVLAGRADILVVMVLSAATSAAFTFDPPGRQAIIPRVVPREHLFSAMGLTRASMQMAHTVGPVIAGILMVPIGIGGVLLVKAGLDVASVGALRRMSAQPALAGARTVSVLRSLREGLSHMRRDEVIRGCIVLQIAFALVASAFMQLLPAFAVETLNAGAIQVSWLVGAIGLGALGGAVVVASAGGVRRPGLLMVLALLFIGLLVTALGFQREMLGAFVILAVLGAVQQVFGGTQAVMLQIAAPDHLRGRVMGIQSVIFMGIGPLGVLTVGTLGTLIGVANAFVLAGTAVIATAAVSLLRAGAVRDFRSRPAPLPVSSIDVAEPAD